MSEYVTDAVKERRVLVVGYGSTLRSDDAAGPAVARHIADAAPRGVRVLTPVHLTPDMAQDLRDVDIVIFVDAAPAEQCPEIRIEPLHVRPGQHIATSAVGHAGDPRSLLDLTEALFGHRPEAWLVAVPAYRMDFGESVSTATAGHVAEAANAIHALLQKVRHA